MPVTFNPHLFNKKLKKQLQDSQIAFEGIYKNELNSLAGLSKTEIDAIAPGEVDLQKYDQLITVVKEASRINLAQAKLRDEIVKLGEIGVQIAKRVPSLAAIF